MCICVKPEIVYGFFPMNFVTGEDNPHEYDSFNPDDHQRHPEADCAVIFRSYPSGAQHERVTDRIREIQPGTAVFVAVMIERDVHNLALFW